MNTSTKTTAEIRALQLSTNATPEQISVSLYISQHETHNQHQHQQEYYGQTEGHYIDDTEEPFWQYE